MNERTDLPDRPPACARVRSRLDELLDRDLPPLEAARDEGHLEACARCAAERRERELELRAWRSALDAPEPSFARALDGLETRLAGAPGPRASIPDPRAAALAAGGGRAFRGALRAAALAAATLLMLFGLRELGIFDLATELDRGRAAGTTAFTSWSFDLGELMPTDLDGLHDGGEL